jgi:hypothetical protein
VVIRFGGLRHETGLATPYLRTWGADWRGTFPREQILAATFLYLEITIVAIPYPDENGASVLRVRVIHFFSQSAAVPKP